MLCDRRKATSKAFGVAVGQWFDKMCILSSTIGASDTVRIIAVEVKTLLWVEQQLKAIVALKVLKTNYVGICRGYYKI